MSIRDESDAPILVTSALPYANGSIHLGHLVEYIQTDIYVRFLKSIGADVTYVCADDTHGAAIEISAAREKVSPEDFIARVKVEHERDLAAFGVAFDAFHSTHSEENRRWATRIYEALRDGGHVTERSSEQLYCVTDERFLPDRFVKGTCPKCGAADQYGDNCEQCGATYEPTDLKGAACAICGHEPEVRSSTHLYVQLEHFADFLKGWTGSGSLQPEIRNFVEGWLEEGLQDWCVTRDGPYFGFEVPDRPGKYFYVWLDAPVGYIASTEFWAGGAGKDVKDYWERPGARILHFIGKDIVYFHTLFWPAMLEGAQLALPERVIVHGMLTVNGVKMSKSRGTFINARTYLEAGLDPEWLRYYYAGNLGARPDDLDLNLEEFGQRINAELVNNVANLCHRAVSFGCSKLEGRIGAPSQGELKTEALKLMDEIRDHYEALDFRKALKAINQLADLGNRHFQDSAPWTQIKTDPEAARQTVTDAVNVSALLAIALAPVVPGLSGRMAEALGLEELGWGRATFSEADRAIGPAVPLASRVEPERVQAMVKPQEELPPPPPRKAEEGQGAEVGLIGFDDFQKVELRVGLVVEAEKVEKADKLLKLAVDLGEDRHRTILAGIAQAYEPETLVGKRVVAVTNLAPRKLRGILSEGMLLAAGPGGAELTLAEIPGEVAPGTRVK
ncbi:MAG: methionine--tRNA ligase [Deltaproteobacteria bacterium]|nr:methionine--tRNA ligase [Deltaproteobacteria bacterium]